MALSEDVSAAEIMQNFHPCHSGQFVHEPMRWQAWLGKEADWYTQDSSSYLLVNKILVYWSHSLVSILRGCMFFALLKRYAQKILPQISFSPFFKIIVFSTCWTSNHTISDSSWIDTTRCTAWSSAYWEDFSSPLSFKDVPERGL